MMEEKRCAVRWNVALPVRYVEPSIHQEGACVTENVSTTGARLVLPRRHKPGEHLSLMMELPETEEQVCLDADVVWQKRYSELLEERNYMVGVVFRRIRDCDKKTIYSYVNSRYPDEIRQRWWDGIK